jgi:NhaA family Na+:H+ antiporter
MVGAGLLGGIGFTMSIFITNLAFADHAAIVNSSKLAVLASSLVAGVLGLVWLRLAPTRDDSLDERRTHVDRMNVV